MAHYISYSLFDSPYYLDNRSNSRANTCAKSWLLCGKDVFIRYNQPFGFLVNHNNWANRMRKRRWFIQVSALSAFDGRVLAYHGVNG